MAEKPTYEQLQNRVSQLLAERSRYTKLEAELKSEGVRVEVDTRSERVNLKIRQAQLDKVPYMLVVGDKEMADSSVSVRLRTEEQLPSQSLDSFSKTINEAIKAKAKDLSR